MRRRLGESCGTWPSKGPPISSDDDDERGPVVAVVFERPHRKAIRAEPLWFARFRLEDDRGHLPEAGFHRGPHLQRVVGGVDRSARP